MNPSEPAPSRSVLLSNQPKTRKLSLNMIFVMENKVAGDTVSVTTDLFLHTREEGNTTPIR